MSMFSAFILWTKLIRLQSQRLISCKFDGLRSRSYYDRSDWHSANRRGYNTKDVFGPYIHKYYYNQSIADGYTLKLIREEIETTYRTQMAATLEQLEVQMGSIKKKDLYSHPKFVKEMVDYIVDDYKKAVVFWIAQLAR